MRSSFCHRSLQNAPLVITSKCTTSDGWFFDGWSVGLARSECFFGEVLADLSGLGRGGMEHGASSAGYGSAGGQPERRTAPKGPMPRVVARRIPRHGTRLPGHCPPAHWPNAENSGGLGAGPHGRRRGHSLRFCGLHRCAGRRGGRRLAGDTFRQAVAATVDGDHFGTVQQAVEDRSGGGDVA